MAATDPRWATSPGAGFPGCVEPDEGKKDDGFANGEEPAAGHFNWFFKRLADIARGSVRVIEAAAPGITLDETDDSQLLAAIEATVLRVGTPHRMASALGQSWTQIHSTTCEALACSSAGPRKLSTLAAGPTARYSPIIAACGNNDFRIGGPYPLTTFLSVSVTAHLRACAVRRSAGAQFAVVAVGDGGKWARWDSAAGGTTGTIGGTPNLTDVQWDEVNGVWWACGAGGIFHATDASSMSWSTDTTSHGFSSILPLPNGWVLCVRTDNNNVNIAHGLTGFISGYTPGASVTGHKPVWDSVIGKAVFVEGDTKLWMTTNGTSADGGPVEATIPTTTGGSHHHLFKFHGQACLARAADAAGNLWLGVYKGGPLGTLGGDDWYIVSQESKGGSQVDQTSLVGCGEIVVGHNSDGIYASPVLVDLDGSRSF